MALSKTQKNIFTAILFLLPNLIGFLCFTAGPVLLSLYMSFTNWSLRVSTELEWIGLRNYSDLLNDPMLWFFLYNTLYFMLGIPFSVFGSLILANMLVSSMIIKKRRKRFTLAAVILVIGFISCALIAANGSYDIALLLAVLYIAGICGVMWGSTTYRTMFYIPSFASGVATVILWIQIFNPHYGLLNGVIDNVLSFVGIHADLPTWLTSTKSLMGVLPFPESFNNGGFGLGAREAMIIMGVWMTIGGNNMILYLASISNIPESLYEAAEMDGAGSMAKFFHITIPSVAPTTFFIAIMSVIGGLQGGFENAKIMTGGGPAGTTTTLAYYIYTMGFEELRFGYASAISWLMFILVFGLTIVNWKYGNRKMEM
ncbi:MAG: sugar ABC transporter permease [Victivallaceae bacterium]|nr:sugar ABC transporter permease [Victivallaceae bacterium]